MCWPYSEDTVAKQKFFEVLIRNHHCAGIFTKEEGDEPIAWCIQYPSGSPGNLFVTEKYRKRGFASWLLEYMCKCIEEDGMVPHVCVDIFNGTGEKLMENMGFQKDRIFRCLRTM